MLTLSIALATAVLGTTAGDQKAYLTFQNYLTKYGFDWEVNSTEWMYRYEIYEAEVARLTQQNQAGNLWTQSINRFSIYTKDEKKRFLGRRKSSYGSLNFRSQANAAENSRSQGITMTLITAANGMRSSLGRSIASQKSLHVDVIQSFKPVSALPVSVDWRKKGVATPVKDQGGCGSCWAFAATEAIESAVAIASRQLFNLSTQQVTFCSPNPNSCGGTGGCQGSTGELAFSYVASSSGLLTESQLPYSTAASNGQHQVCSLPASSPVATISGYVVLPTNNYTALMNTIANVGPVVVAVAADGWFSYSSGIYSNPLTSSTDINHAVVLMGYGTDAVTKTPYWLIRNQWGTFWGENGYMRLNRASAFNDACAMDTTPQDGNACAGDNTPVRVCGISGILFDSTYPIGARAFTQANSMSPTYAITSAPSSKINGLPTAHPSANPTSKPSIKPTISPTTSPKGASTTKPSLHPTASPSRKPTKKPTCRPSIRPFSPP